jgi:hypothetical protein
VARLVLAELLPRARPGQVRPEQVRPGQVRPEQVLLEQVLPEQVRSVLAAAVPQPVRAARMPAAGCCPSIAVVQLEHTR